MEIECDVFGIVRVNVCNKRFGFQKNTSGNQQGVDESNFSKDSVFRGFHLPVIQARDFFNFSWYSSTSSFKKSQPKNSKQPTEFISKSPIFPVLFSIVLNAMLVSITIFMAYIYPGYGPSGPFSQWRPMRLPRPAWLCSWPSLPDRAENRAIADTFHIHIGGNFNDDFRWSAFDGHKLNFLQK